MKDEHSKGTFILGCYYSSEELTEIENNPAFKNSLTKKILDLRYANEKFREELFETKLFKLLNKILEKVIK